MIALPSYIDPETFAAYVEMRREVAKKVKAKVFTQFAEKLVVMKLMKMHNEGFDPNASLAASITNSWTDVYPRERYSVEPAKFKDPALLKIEEDAKRAAPMPDEIRKLKERLVR